MATPLTDGINALTAYANEVTGASDTTLSDAVESLVSGYGQGGGAETVTVTATATSTDQCMQNLFGVPEPGYLYIAVLTGKQQALWTTDQFIGGIGYKHNNSNVFQGTAMRFRNSNFNPASIAGNYDGKVEVGDVFTVIKIPYS